MRGFSVGAWASLPLIRPSRSFSMSETSSVGTLASDTSSEMSSTNFVLQLLHASDWEAGVKAVDRAANFAAIIDILEEDYENTLILSSGDGWIPGPFYASSADS